MTFIVVAVIAFHIALITRKYRSGFSAVAAIAFLGLITTGVLSWGVFVADTEGRIIFFYGSIGREVFYTLMAGWYSLDILSSVKIIRNHIEYREFNKRNKT
ncbi:MAG: hypothetical protein A2W19_03680 [Spirochaetes bacterium RBG_16_49_21]|nr:MAG: hypothetical protein A2W19_03680 [Spirochaetes bacterium RBG_16_49_21]